MPRVQGNAVDTQPTIGVAFGAEHARSRRDMGVISIQATRFSVRRYHLNRGAFLPVAPALNLVLDVAGVVGTPGVVTWESLADKTWALWDGGNAEKVWVATPGSMRLQMLASTNSLIEVVDGLPGVRSCRRRSFGAARTAPGGRYGCIVPQSRQAWLVTALRIPEARNNGILVSMVTLGGRLAVRKEGAVYVVSLDEFVIARRPAGLLDSHPLVLGLQIDNGEASVRIWDSGGTTSVQRFTMSDVLVSSAFELGGPDNPGALIYMVGYGTGVRAGEIMESVTGFLSC